MKNIQKVILATSESNIRPNKIKNMFLVLLPGHFFAK